MLDFLFSGWGAFWTTLFMLVPFAAVFWYVLHRKSVVDPSPGATPRAALSRLEAAWIGAVVVIFAAINLASLKYMPILASARAATAGGDVQAVDLTATSWAYDLSTRQVEAGRPVRFSGRSSDTMHGFAVYDPHGRLLFTMMLMPGLARPTSLLHTFDEPGRYTVRCLEYCGVAHHTMRDEIVVVARR